MFILMRNIVTWRWYFLLLGEMERRQKLKLLIGIKSYFFLSALLIAALAVTIKVEAKDPNGFITLDCGLPNGSYYVDEATGIKYISDAAFVDTGVNMTILPSYNTSDTDRWLQTVRSFPEGTRNCYNIRVEKGTQYLIRATFMHGGYDGFLLVKMFDLYLGCKKWVTIGIDDANSVIYEEIIHVTTTNYLYICLANTGGGTPFISVLELRPLRDGPYNMSSGSLGTLVRLDFCSTASEIVRYPDDDLDRRWEPHRDADWTTLSTTEAIHYGDYMAFKPPSVVLRTACTPTNSTESLEFLVKGYFSEIHLYLYVAEIEKVEVNQSRQFVLISSQGTRSRPLSPKYLNTTIIYYPEYSLSHISLDKTANSTLPPILNAIEVYYVVYLSQPQSDQVEVDAMMNIKLMYGIKRNWQGDPCVPQDSVWNGISCNYSNSDVPKIVSVDLSSSALVGEIASFISNLTLLEKLDLSNNNLTGPVPEFMAQLQFLTVLNLANNNLNGSVPPALIEKSKSNRLLLITNGNPDLCASISCNNNSTTNSNNSSSSSNIKPNSGGGSSNNNKSSLFVFLLLASIAAALIAAIVFVIVIRLAIIQRRVRRKRPANWEVYSENTKTRESSKYKKGRFSYAQLLAITNNFRTVLGTGGSGTVYLGYLHGNQVAVKVLSSSSAQGYKQFQAEVDVLLRVHHGNLLSLVGYCDESNQIGLIYEYMANGNLQEYISDKRKDTLSWEERLRISLGAAKGLDYLHNDCEPQIVHRDVKTANILLNEKLQAKVADFGLSRSFPITGASHVFTDVVGTFGYFDPEYFRSRRFTTKSDVYSFGVVLLEIVTGKPAVTETEEMIQSLSQWVTSMLANGEVANIVDPKLNGDFDINSVKKVVDVAMACVSESSSERPTMHRVVNEFTGCFAIELARRNREPEAEPKGSPESVSDNEGA